MQSGSPTFGTPESGIGLLCTGQIARHFDLPFRTGGGLTSSQVPDAQAGYEALMTMLPTFLAGANYVMHSAGWLEGGLVAGYEKFVIDVELVQMLQHEFTPLEIDEASLAFGAHEEVGHGGHFLGAMHTMERFRTCFYRPMLSLVGELRALDAQRRQGHRRPGHRALPEASSTSTSSRPSTTRSARSSRSTSYAGARSSATDGGRGAPARGTVGLDLASREAASRTATVRRSPGRSSAPSSPRPNQRLPEDDRPRAVEQHP